jgi:hypothetical protein
MISSITACYEIGVLPTGNAQAARALQIDIIVTHFNSSGAPSYLRYLDVIQEAIAAQT